MILVSSSVACSTWQLAIGTLHLASRMQQESNMNIDNVTEMKWGSNTARYTDADEEWCGLWSTLLL